jgi:hypothetical protein
MTRQTLDWRALGAFLLFPLCYGTALLGPAFYQHTRAPNGQPDLFWEGVAYSLMATILATGSHAITFAVFWLRYPTWPALGHADARATHLDSWPCETLQLTGVPGGWVE